MADFSRMVAEDGPGSGRRTSAVARVAAYPGGIAGSGLHSIDCRRADMLPRMPEHMPELDRVRFYTA